MPKVSKLSYILDSMWDSGQEEPMSEKDMTAIQKARLAYREEISHHRREIIRIQRELNKLAPVSRLPPEILGAIFVYVTCSQDRLCDDDDGEELSELPISGRADWLSFSHTCFHWRQVALNTPRVWSVIGLTFDDELTRELFIRSKNAPLHILIPWAFLDKTIWALAMEHIHRIRTLDLLFERRSQPNDLLSSLSSAPELRCLALDVEYGLSDRSPPTIMNDWNLPKLSQLEIRHGAIHLPWSHPILKNSLTHLVLQRSAHANTETLNVVLNALAGMPLLRVLDLRHVLPRSFSSGTSRAVSLPKLQSLRIHDLSFCCIPFLQTITFPNTALLTLKVSIPSPRHATAIYDEVTTKLPDFTLPDTCIRSVHIDYYHLSWRIMVWVRAFGAMELVEAVNAEDSLHWRLDLHANKQTEEILPPIYGFLPLSTARILHLKTDTTFQSDWRALSNAMPHIQELVIDATDCPKWEVPQLIAVFPPTPNSPTGEVRFPALRVLTLIRQKIHRSFQHYYGKDGELLQRIRQILERRMEAGHAVGELVLERPINITQDDVDTLSGVVGKVTWNPDEVLWDDDNDPRKSYHEKDCTFTGVQLVPFEGETESELDEDDYSSGYELDEDAGLLADELELN